MVENRITVQNSGDSTIQVWVEPWGDVLELAANHGARFVATSPQAGEFEVEHRSGEIVVWGWPGCTMKVFDADSGKELDLGSLAVTVPPLPKGTR